MDFTWGVTSYNEKFQKNTIIYIYIPITPISD